MNARPAKVIRGRQEPSDSDDQCERGSRPAAAPSPRVRSVSARAVTHATERTSSMTATNDRTEPVFLSPRVIDQKAFDDLAGTLRRLIDQAEHAGKELASRVEQVASAKQDQAKSTEQLQERLRLSARMLKAFQSQIVRTEGAIEGLTTHEEKVHAVEHHAEQAADAAQHRIDAAMDAAMERLNQRLEERIATALERLDREIDARAERVRRIAAEVDALAPAADRLTEVAEQAEITVVSMSHRVATLAVDLAERGETIEQLIDRAGASTKQLDENLRSSVEQIDQFVERSGRVADHLESACERGESERAEILQQIEAAHVASRELVIDVQACEALETLLEQLKPWEAFVLDRDERHDAGSDNEADLPEPAARLVGELRQRLDHDLAEFSAVLAHVAEQFRAFSSREHVRREVRERDAREESGGSNAIPATDGGDGSVVSVIRPASPLSFSSHAKLSQAE